VASGCVGTAFPGYNGPAGVAALDDAAFDRSKTYPLYLPNAPIPGLPDPAAVGAAIAAQLATTLGVQVHVISMPASALRAAIADGTIEGLYVDAVTSPVADAATFFQALYADRAGSAAAKRASGIATRLAAAAGVTDPAGRTAALTAISNAARTSAGLVPLVSTGGMTAWRTDVAGAAASPLGSDPLGAMTAGDRGQVVFLQTTPAGGGWCGASETTDAWRLCALISDGLYALPQGATAPQPRLASVCTPSENATVWTCRLRAGLRTGDGETLDARDVLATFRAAWDATSPARAASGGTGETWKGLFGGPLNPPPAG
jgi:ABC-type transport system substrate-binding protein